MATIARQLAVSSDQGAGTGVRTDGRELSDQQACLHAHIHQAVSHHPRRAHAAQSAMTPQWRRNATRQRTVI